VITINKISIKDACHRCGKTDDRIYEVDITNKHGAQASYVRLCEVCLAELCGIIRGIFIKR